MVPKKDQKRILKMLKDKLVISRLDALHELRGYGSEADFAVQQLETVIKKDSDDLARINALDIIAKLSENKPGLLRIIKSAASSERMSIKRKAEKLLQDLQETESPISTPEFDSIPDETVTEELHEESQAGFFTQVTEERFQQPDASSSEINMDFHLEEFGVGETSEVVSKTETVAPPSADSVSIPTPEPPASDENAIPVSEPIPVVEQEEDYEIEEEKIEPEEVIVVERNIEEEIILKELGETPLVASKHNLELLFSKLDDVSSDDKKSMSFLHLKINESLDSLVEYVYKLIGITSEDEWKKFIVYKFSTGDQENLRNIISLLTNKLQSGTCDFCIVSYLVFLGSVSQKLNMNEETIEFYRFILEREPKNMIVLHNLGMFYGKLGKIDDAIKQFEKMLEMEPENTQASSKLGDLYFYEKKEFDKAIEYYRKTLLLEPTRSSVAINLAAILSKTEKFDEAVSILHASLKIVPNNADLWLNYAILLVKQRMFSEAIEAYEKALKNAPEDWSFRERALAEKEKVEQIVSSPEYLKKDKKEDSVSAEVVDVERLFIFAQDPLDDEVFEAIFDWFNAKKLPYNIPKNFKFGHGSIIDSENFPLDPLAAQNFAEIIWQEQFEQELVLAKFRTEFFELEEYGKIIIFVEG